MKSGSILFDQPVRYIVHLLMDWISLAELARLDSAACGRAIREQFLHYLRSKSFIANGAARYKAGNVENYLRWLAVREVKASTLNLSIVKNGIALDTVRAAVRGNHIHTVKLDASNADATPALSAIAATCHRLQYLHVSVRDDSPDIWKIIQANHQTLSTIELHGRTCLSCFSSAFASSHVAALSELRTLRLSFNDALEEVLQLLLPATSVLETFEAWKARTCWTCATVAPPYVI